MLNCLETYTGLFAQVYDLKRVVQTLTELN